MKTISKICIALLTVLLVLGSNINFTNAVDYFCNGSYTFFNRAYVDSNTYSYLTSTNDYYSRVSSTSVYINKINKADDTSSSYSKLRLRVDIGKHSQHKTVTKFKTYTFDVPECAKENTPVAEFYAMGNNSSLDCIAYGYVYTSK